MRSMAVIAFLGLMLAACDEEPVAVPDANQLDASLPDAGGPDAALLYDPPAQPVFRPCPMGWREHQADGVTTCEPWPETGQQDCTLGEAHFPGEPGCRPIGTPCPEGSWPVDLPDENVLYVHSEASGGGDGTREQPFRTIAAALAEAPPRSTIALTRGVYREVVELRVSVTLVGVCVAETVIEAPRSGSGLAAVTVDLGEEGTGADGREFYGATLRHLQIRGERQGIRVSQGLLWLRGVLIDGASSVGVLAEEGVRVLGEDVVIRGTRVTAWDGQARPQNGDGLGIFRGSLVWLEGAVLEANERHDATLSGMGATLNLDRARLGDTPLGGLGAVYAEYGARVTLDRTVVERSRGLALSALDPGTHIRLQDVIVRDTESTDPEGPAVRLDGQDGRGLGAFMGGTIEAQRLVVERNRDVGLLVSDQHSRLTAFDLVVRDTRSRLPDGTSGRGLVNQEGGRVVIERALFLRNREYTVFAGGPGTTLVLTDVGVRRALQPECSESACPDADGGYGLACQAGAVAEVRRFQVLDSSRCGVQLSYGGGSCGALDLHDGEISGNPVGINLYCEDFDETRLQDHVVFRGNGQDLLRGPLPAP